MVASGPVGTDVWKASDSAPKPIAPSTTKSMHIDGLTLTIPLTTGHRVVMSRRSISLSAGVCPELAPSPATFVSAAAEAGWPLCGVWFDPDSWTSATSAEISRRMDSSAITALDMEVVRIGARDDHGERIVDAAASVGAANILVVSSDPKPGRTAERLAELCERAAPANIRVCLEFMRFTEVRCLSDALEVVALADQANAGVLVDTLHVWRAGDTYDDVAAVDPRLVPYAQWCDAPPIPIGTDNASLLTDALDDRLCPGEGGLDAAAFPGLFGPEVPMSLEIRSLDLRTRFPDPVERSRHVLAATERALASADS